MKPDFSRRSDTPELMDTDCEGFEDLQACLRDLSRVNVMSLAYRPTLAWLERVAAARSHDAPLCILDVACGHGDMLRRVRRWAARRGVPVALTGIDLNPLSLAAARQATPPEFGIDWIVADIFAFAPERPVDIVISSLFTHHLPDEDVVRFIEWMERTARRGWMINDLHRHALPYHGFRLLAALAGWHRFVRHDGPVSIARAFTRRDWSRLLARAGAAPVARMEWWFPFRLCIRREK